MSRKCTTEAMSAWQKSEGLCRQLQEAMAHSTGRGGSGLEEETHKRKEAESELQLTQKRLLAFSAWSSEHASQLGLTDVTQVGGQQLQRVLQEYRERLSTSFLEKEELNTERALFTRQYASMEDEYTALFERAKVQIEAFVEADHQLTELRKMGMSTRGHVIERLVSMWGRNRLSLAMERWGGVVEQKRLEASIHNSVAQDVAACQEVFALQNEEKVEEIVSEHEAVLEAVRGDKTLLLSEIRNLKEELSAIVKAPPGSPTFVEKIQSQLQASRETGWELTRERDEAMADGERLRGKVKRLEEKVKEMKEMECLRVEASKAASDSSKAASDSSKAASDSSKAGEVLTLRASVRTLKKRGNEREKELSDTMAELTDLKAKLEGRGAMQVKLAGVHDLQKQNCKLRDAKKKLTTTSAALQSRLEESDSKYKTTLKA